MPIPKYPTIQLKQVVWRFKDVDDIPKGFSREEAITSPSDVYDMLHFLFDDLTHERFIIIMLSTINKVQAIDIVTEGILNSSLVHPREVFRAAIRANCASIILAHNHPSGNPEPSSEDVNITKQCVDVGKIVGIPVHDHIIFAGSTYTSFVERGLI